MGKKSKSKAWHLNPDEVSCGWHSSSTGKSGIFERKFKTTSRQVFLSHDLTDTKVEGEIPAGNYSKKEMQKKTKELEEILFSELELKVAKKLKIKGT
jgi:hypothetical protein